MAVVDVALGARSYQVHIGAGLLPRLGEIAAPLLAREQVAIVTDSNVAAHWQETVDSALRSAGKVPAWLVHEPGEAAKSWDGLARTVDFLLAQGVERGDHIIALGGGVIGDLAGFAASIVKRGCGFIQLPTTLLAQVDSSVGGKTAINVPAGKNLVGAFHQPALVLADLDTLTTLPPREMRAGYAEVVKYGVLGDAEFFEWCEANSAKVLEGNRAAQEYAVEQSVAAKARIVAEDERETTGRRALLNLGHTFGHALEAETGFSDRLHHGEGVALGMVLAARFSASTGRMSGQDAGRIAAHIAASGMPAELSALNLDCDGRKLADHMRHDKKMAAGTLPFVLLKGIGEAYLDKNVSLDEVAAFLDQQLEA